MFHAGDGNLHPLILYDANKPGEMDKAEAFGADILRCCVELGGVLTGEHGVGIEKRDLMPEMFSEIDLNQQQRLKCAFDARACSIPARSFRPCIAAPSLAACMCTAASWPSLNSHGFEQSRGYPESTWTPRSVEQAVRAAIASEQPLEIIGHGSKRLIGQPMRPMRCSICPRSMRVTSYEPNELIITVEAGAPLADVLSLIDSKNQQFAFEPINTSVLLGTPNIGTVGGMISAGLARSAPHQGRRRPRSSARRPRGVRFRRQFQGRWPGGEKRHRL